MQNTLFFTIVGAPNAGKSTLTNQLVGQKVTIVTPKVQTTRARMTGIAMLDANTQAVLVDTPGIFTPRKTLDKAMVKAAWGGLKEADVTALLIDVRKGITDDVRQILNGIKQRGCKTILLLNKVDLLKDKVPLLKLAETLNAEVDFDATFMISALKDKGLEALKTYMIAQAREEPWPFPEDQIAGISQRLMAAETTREKLMLALNNELPYELFVDTERWEERRDGSVKVDQVIYVTQESHKRIIVGKGGDTIKRVGEASRKELSYLFERPVHVFLFVKVDENWHNKEASYVAMGFDER